MEKEMYISCLEEIYNVCINNGFTSELLDEVKVLQKEIAEFKIKIPLVGGFNAGKSSLINKFIGKKILPEEITPETAIASEIKYGPNMIVAHRSDGSSAKYPLGDIKKIDSNEYKYLEVFCNRSILKELGEDIVIVDMPGFDSRIEDHNKAITQYLDNGVAFILVIDSEDGCMKSSLLTLLYELSSYQLNFGVVINKSDKKIESDMEEISENIRITVEPISEGSIVESTSIFDDDTPDKLRAIINSFDIDKIINLYFKDKVLNVCERILSRLDILLRNSNVDSEDINKKINSIQEKMIDLDDTLKKEEKNIEKRIHAQTKDNILNDISEYLYNNSNILSSSILEGEYAFKIKLNELLRPMLINSTSRNLETIFSELLNTVSLKIDSMDEIAQDIQGRISDVSHAIKGVENSLKIIQENKALIDKFEKYYRVATGGLAIMTTVVAPWIELIIVFLPDIVKFLGAITGNTQQEKMKAKVENEIIPNIISKLEPEIEQSLYQMKNDFMVEIGQDIQKRKDDLESSLNKAIEMKNMKEIEFNRFIDSIKNDIKIIENIVEDISGR